MPDRVYKKIEITGTSSTSVEDAVKCAVERAATTVRNMRWFEVSETRGRIDGGKVVEWQVTVKIGFALDDEANGDSIIALEAAGWIVGPAPP